MNKAELGYIIGKAEYKIISPTQGYDPKLCLHERFYFFLDFLSSLGAMSLNGIISCEVISSTKINYNIIFTPWDNIIIFQTTYTSFKFKHINMNVRLGREEFWTQGGLFNRPNTPWVLVYLRLMIWIWLRSTLG